MEKRPVSRVTRDPSPAALKPSPRIATSCEVFADGSAVELLRDSGTGASALLVWDGKQATVAKEFTCGGHTYVPCPIPGDMGEAIALPTGHAPHGSAQSLFSEISEAFQRYTSLAEESAFLVTFFVLASWFTDLLPTAPCLLICGPAESEARALLRVLRCVCRRALSLAELTPSSFATLPFSWRPTLLMIQQEISPSLEGLLLASNSRGIHLLRNGKLVDPFCAKAVYCPTVLPESHLMKTAITVGISPATMALPVFDTQAEEALLDHLVPKLLGYRLANAARIRSSQFDAPRFTSSLRELARSLGAAVEGDEELQSRLERLLEEQNTEAKAERWDFLESVMLEGLLFRCHQPEKDRLYVGELTQTVQAILVGREEKIELEPRAVGAQLKALGLHTASLGSAGRGLLLTNDIRRRIHDLARAYGVRALEAPKGGCPLCAEPVGTESVDTKSS